MSLIDKLTVAVMPLDIVPGDKATNIAAVRGGMVSLPQGVDLVVLPELFSTAFIADADEARRLAEDNSGETMTELRRMAAEYRIAISGSFLAADGPLLYNRAFIIEPDGETSYYDKRHLLSLSQEADICIQGMRRSPVVRYRGWNIAMAVCYDLRFPVWMRNEGMRYDIMIVPANWPDKRKYAWEHLLIARAIENQACIVGANRSGMDDYGTYTASSFAFDQEGMPTGTYVAGGYLIATFSKARLGTFRRILPFWKDADTYRL